MDACVCRLQIDACFTRQTPRTPLIARFTCQTEMMLPSSIHFPLPLLCSDTSNVSPLSLQQRAKPLSRYILQSLPIAPTTKCAIQCQVTTSNISPPILQRRTPSLSRTCTVMATKDPYEFGQELMECEKNSQDYLKGTDTDHLEGLKARFLKFKKQNYLKNLDHFQNLAQGQSPKFMVVACADSRVCPSKILGFQPGEAFTVRNVANLVPPYIHGASETSAALEFAVNSLKVSNILIVGHSCCGGIRALMSMKRNSDSKSFIQDWVSVAKSARLSTEAAVGNLSFDKQCTYCEKESINGSLLNLLSYPWIEEKVTQGLLLLHGGYYDFTNCTFEKWTLVYRENLEGGSKFAIQGCSTWS